MARPRFQLAEGRTFTLGGALFVTAASALLPGLAHLRAARRGAGIALFAGYAVLAGLLVPTGLVPTGLAPAVSFGARHSLVYLGPAMTAGAWVLLLLLSYRVVRPGALTPAARLAGGAVVALLCASAAVVALAPVAGHPNIGARTRGTVRSAPTRPVPMRPPAPVPPAWPDGPRLNLLLVSTRTGSGGPALASVDTRSGDTVLLELPGRLRRLRLHGAPRTLRLDEVYAYGRAHPRLAGGPGQDPGVVLLRRAVRRATGLPVDYYRLVSSREMRRIDHAARRSHGCGGAPLLLDGGHAPSRTDLPRKPPASLTALAARMRRARISRVRPAAARRAALRASVARAVGGGTRPRGPARSRDSQGARRPCG